MPPSSGLDRRLPGDLSPIERREIPLFIFSQLLCEMFEDVGRRKARRLNRCAGNVDYL
jgi:hypothetical protein